MGEAVADDGRILQAHARGLVGVDGAIHAGSSFGEAGRIWRWQRTLCCNRADGAGSAACRCLGHRPQDGAGLRCLDRDAPTAGELQCGRPAPWTEASKRFFETMSATTTGGPPHPDWREAFAKWSEISNEEL